MIRKCMSKNFSMKRLLLLLLFVSGCGDGLEKRPVYKSEDKETKIDLNVKEVEMENTVVDESGKGGI